VKKLLIAVLALGLAGCSTTPTPSNSAKPVPQSRILWKSQGDSILTITRDKGWFAGGGCFVTVTVDGKPVARIDTGESVTIKVNSGRHILAITGDKGGRGLCGFQIGQPIKENATEIKPKEIQKYRITGDTSSGLDLRPTTI
jgi:hypothetical protein